MKKFFYMLLVCCMLMTWMVSPVYAADTETKADVTIIELSDTLTVEISLETFSNYRANITGGRKNFVVKSGGREVGSATLYATFEYNGTTAWVTATDYTKTTASGCTYSHGGITTSGNRATMTGSFLYGGTSYPFSISLTCSGSGTVS